jgi:uncharacterized protein YlxW (UPF0749 family)
VSHRNFLNPAIIKEKPMASAEPANPNARACEVCDYENPQDHLFCGKCGAPLDEQALLSEHIRAILRSELKDRKLVEVEVTHAVVSRVANWAKLFAFFTAIPLVLLLGSLAIWSVTKAGEVNYKLRTAETRAQELTTASDQMEQRYKSLEKDLGNYESLNSQIQQESRKSEAVEGDIQTLKNGIVVLNKKIAELH